jgi:hypothetical protein
MKRKIQQQAEQIKRLTARLSQRDADVDVGGGEGLFFMLSVSLFFSLLRLFFFLILHYLPYFSAATGTGGRPFAALDKGVGQAPAAIGGGAEQAPASLDGGAGQAPAALGEGAGQAPAALGRFGANLPILRTADSDRQQRLQKKHTSVAEEKEKEQQLLKSVREKETEALGKLRKLLRTPLYSNSAASAAMIAGNYLYFLADFQADDNDDDSDDEDYNPSSNENSDDETAVLAAERGKRHADVEPVGLDRPPFFRTGAVNSIDHLKSSVPFSKLSKGRAVEMPVGLEDCLYEDVPEPEFISFQRRILTEPWDEETITFLKQLLTLLDHSVTDDFKDAVVWFFLWVFFTLSFFYFIISFLAYIHIHPFFFFFFL